LTTKNSKFKKLRVKNKVVSFIIKNEKISKKFWGRGLNPPTSPEYIHV